MASPWSCTKEDFAALQTDTNPFLQVSVYATSKCNLSANELSAMKKATTDKDIIIRPADKGGRWVILDSRLYRSECLQQLCDDSFYAAIQELSTPQHSRVTDILLDFHRRGFLSRKELRFLLPPESPRTRRSYILPKVHKLLRPNGVPPGRPIVSDVGSATYHAGKLVDFFLGPLAQRLQSHLSDSYELIAKLSCVSINSNTVFCTLDVRSLYTNIPIEEGLRRVRRAFARYPSTDRPDKEILELLRLSLTTNDFQFEDSSWLQISGVAMGKAFGGAFANIYMGDWETEVLSSVATVPSTWYRYQDDIFFLWDHPVDLLDRFLASINAVDPHIQVDLTFNKRYLFPRPPTFQRCERNWLPCLVQTYRQSFPSASFVTSSVSYYSWCYLFPNPEMGDPLQDSRRLFKSVHHYSASLAGPRHFAICHQNSSVQSVVQSRQNYVVDSRLLQMRRPPLLSL